MKNAWDGKPALRAPGSSANYWPVEYAALQNMQWVIHQVDTTIPIFKEPHVAITGTVLEVIHEADADIHFWLRPDGTTKDRMACEIVPQNPLTPPAVGDHVTVFGIYRYDIQHGWDEIHPVDHIQPA